jgi:hypothetical protein
MSHGLHLFVLCINESDYMALIWILFTLISDWIKWRMVGWWHLTCYISFSKCSLVYERESSCELQAHWCCYRCLYWYIELSCWGVLFLWMSFWLFVTIKYDKLTSWYQWQWIYFIFQFTNILTHFTTHHSHQRQHPSTFAMTHPKILSQPDQL